MGTSSTELLKNSTISAEIFYGLPNGDKAHDELFGLPAWMMWGIETKFSDKTNSVINGTSGKEHEIHLGVNH